MRTERTEKQIRILLVDAQEIYRIGLAAALRDEDAIHVAADAANLREGIRLFGTIRPDVVISALRLRDACLIDDLPEFFAINSQARILILADRAGDAEISRAMRLGARGCICRDAKPELLKAAIRTLFAGRRYLSPEIAKLLSENLWQEELTPAEERVLRMLVGGMANKEIAFALDVSENTVKTHISAIFEKLGVSDRTSAATLAIRRGLVKIDL